MSDQQQMWNSRFSKEGFMYGQTPNAFIKQHLSLLKQGGRVLCLAEGEGRNAVYLAQQGYEVEALDASDVGLQKMHNWAKEHDLSIAVIHTDLEDWHPAGSYDAIVASFMHLPEPLRSQSFKRAIEALKPQGYLIMEFFSKNQMLQNFTSGGPKDLNLLYDTTELKKLCDRDDTAILHLAEEIDTLDEGWGHQGQASLIRLILQKK